MTKVAAVSVAASQGHAPGGTGHPTRARGEDCTDPEATPRFRKGRSVPYVLRDKVDAELGRLVNKGTLEPVQFLDWAAPIVVVLKSDKSSIRICGNFKQTVNPVSKLDKYPIPKVEDLSATLVGGRVFSKVNLSQAYQQLSLDEESKKLMVINTMKGLFRYTRLPFGISSAPGIFQRATESVLQGIPGVIVYLDDILWQLHRRRNTFRGWRWCSSGWRRQACMFV